MTFMCGRAGVCALGAVIAKHADDKRLLDHYLTQFKAVFNLIFNLYYFNDNPLRS